LKYKIELVISFFFFCSTQKKNSFIMPNQTNTKRHRTDPEATQEQERPNSAIEALEASASATSTADRLQQYEDFMYAFADSQKEVLANLSELQETLNRNDAIGEIR
jgi:hypothetical protein